jgi:hypothetical protein
VHSTSGIVACTQPLACQAGLRILSEGGNAAVSSWCRSSILLQGTIADWKMQDAAVAVGWFPI